MVSTRLLLTVTALLLAAVGVPCLFAPDEICRFFEPRDVGLAGLIVQLGGTACLGLAMLDWMSKGMTIGGIYGRPLILANLLHFLAGALALIRFVSHVTEVSAVLWSLAAAYTIVASMFAFTLLRPPAATAA